MKYYKLPKRKFYWNGYKVSGKQFYKNYKETYGREYRSLTTYNDNLSADWLLMEKISLEITKDMDMEILKKLKEITTDMDMEIVKKLKEIAG